MNFWKTPSHEWVRKQPAAPPVSFGVSYGFWNYLCHLSERSLCSMEHSKRRHSRELRWSLENRGPNRHTPHLWRPLSLHFPTVETLKHRARCLLCDKPLTCRDVGLWTPPCRLGTLQNQDSDPDLSSIRVTGEVPSSCLVGWRER